MVNVVSIFFGVASGILTWFATNLAEDAISESMLTIFRNFTDIASSYNPVAGSLIGVIPSIFIACSTFAGIEAVIRQFDFP